MNEERTYFLDHTLDTHVDTVKVRNQYVGASVESPKTASLVRSRRCTTLRLAHARNEVRFIVVVFGPATRSDTCRAAASPAAVAAGTAGRPHAQHARSG